MMKSSTIANRLINNCLLPGLLLLVVTTAASAQFPSSSSSSFSSPRQLQECQNYAPPAVIKGSKIFVSTTGEHLPIKGINYYPRPNAGDLTQGNSQDFYTEEFRSNWERDIASFVALGVNAIRVYAIDPGLNHDAFMCALKAVGIYVIVGLAADCQDCAVQWEDPPACYPATLKTRGEFIISQFAKYENVLGFSAGNEIALSANSNLGNLPCQKKFLKDMRQYVRDCTASSNMRHIPIGIIFADHERAAKAQYYNCQSSTPGDDDDLEMAEFLGINAYLHCDGNAVTIDQLVGYQTLLQDFASYGMTIPVMWTEFGCLNESFETIGATTAQRNFLQVDALFSPSYQEVFNGGFVFEYSTEKIYSEAPFPFTSYGPGNYGIGYFSPENCNHMDVPCEYIPFPQFDSLANRYSAVVTSGVTLDSYVPPTQAPPACPVEIPPLDAFDWPTDSSLQEQRATRQCPAYVPVYCAGIPGECTTVVTTTEGTSPAPTVEAAVAGTTTAPSSATTTTPEGTPAPTTPTATQTPTLMPSTMAQTTASPTGAPTIKATRPPIFNNNGSNNSSSTQAPTFLSLVSNPASGGVSSLFLRPMSVTILFAASIFVAAVLL